LARLLSRIAAAASPEPINRRLADEPAHSSTRRRQRYPSLREAVHRQLREGILNGVFRRGGMQQQDRRKSPAVGA
jgi:hypothetical protein